MSPEQRKKLEQLKDGATAALIRAGQHAREIALQTGTHVVVMRDDQLIEEIPMEDMTPESK